MTLEEAVREVLYAHGTRYHIAGADFNASDLETAARDLATRIGRGVHKVAVGVSTQGLLPDDVGPVFVAEFIGDTPKEKK